MDRAGRKRATGLALLASVCCLVLPSTATGLTRSNSVEFTVDGQVESVTAHCPRGFRATGGGFKAPAPTSTMSSFTDLKIFVSRKLHQRAWKVSGQENALNPPTPLALKAYVYCSRHAPKTHAVVKNKQLPAHPMGFTPARAHCESGKAQAGGFAIPTPNFDGDLIDSFRTSKSSWRTRVDADFLDSFKSIVYCAGRPAPTARSGHLDRINREVGTASSKRCRHGTHPLAGGFEQPNAITGFAGSDFRNFNVNRSFRSGRRWKVFGEHGGMTTSRLISTAYCG